MRLKNWTAKRAGGRITVYGVDPATNKDVKIVGVDMIEAAAVLPFVIATDKDGTRHELIPSRE